MIWKRNMVSRNIITQILHARQHGLKGWTRAPAREMSSPKVHKDPAHKTPRAHLHADLTNKEKVQSKPNGLLIGAGTIALLIALGCAYDRYMKDIDEIKEDGYSSTPKVEDKSNEPAPGDDAGPKEGAKQTEKDCPKEKSKSFWRWPIKSSKPEVEDKSNELAPGIGAGPKEGAKQIEKDCPKEETKEDKPTDAVKKNDSIKVITKEN